MDLRLAAANLGLGCLAGLRILFHQLFPFYFGSIDMPPGLVALFFASIILTNLAPTTLILGHRPTRITVLPPWWGWGRDHCPMAPVFADGQMQADWFTLRQAGICFLGTLVVSFAPGANAPKYPVGSLSAPLLCHAVWRGLCGAVFLGSGVFI